MEKVLNLEKRMSETPLECLERFRKANPEYINEKMTYAGRLDPMAEGKLIVLVGEECKQKDKYLEMDKEYEVDILFAFKTDSYDILGLIEEVSSIDFLVNYDISQHDISLKRFLENTKGKFLQKYPIFSSKTIKGKPLFQITKDGELGQKEIPKKEVEIYKSELLKSYYISGRDLKANIMKRILLLKGDFRQEEILEKWNQELRGREEEKFLLSKIRIKCSSGTYMRTLANRLGEFLEIPALAFKIKRTQIFSK